MFLKKITFDQMANIWLSIADDGRHETLGDEHIMKCIHPVLGGVIITHYHRSSRNFYLQSERPLRLLEDKTQGWLFMITSTLFRQPRGSRL